MNLAGRWDRHKICDLGEKLGMIERAVGYRQPMEADGYEIMKDIFACSDSGLSRRLGGQVKVTDFELSRIVHYFGLDIDGIHPDDLLLDAAAFGSKLKAMGVGIYGAAEPLRFAAAARAFAGASASIELKPVRRGSGFGPEGYLENRPTLALTVGQRVRFRCRSDAEGALLVVDHRIDEAETAYLLSPATTRDWIRAQPKTGLEVPRNGQPMLHVHPASGRRRVTTLWVDQAFGEEIEASIEAYAVAHWTAASKRDTVGYRVRGIEDTSDPGFRSIPVAQLASLTRELERGSPAIKAVAGCDYEVRSNT